MPRKKKILSAHISIAEFNNRRAFFKSTSSLISIIATIIVTFFTWLQFQGIPFPEINDDFSTILLKVALSLYYFSWIAGTKIDLEDEEYTLIIAPNNGKLTRTGIGMIVTLGVLFVMLCYLQSFQYFAIAITIFFIFDRIAGNYLMRFARPVINSCKEKLIDTKNYTELLSLKSIEYYLFAKWRIYRFYSGLFLLMIVNIMAFTPLPRKLSEVTNINSSNFFIVSSIALFLLIVELWIWYIRLKRKIILRFLYNLNENYIVAPKPNLNGNAKK